MIYYYRREGLLPPGQKSGGSPAVYGDEHVLRLQEIVSLREEGLSLAQVRERLCGACQPPTAQTNMVEARANEIKSLLLDVAARHFAMYGYRGARISDIIAEAQLAPYSFYRNFDSKRALFVEVVETFVEKKIHEVEDFLASESDPVVRHILRTVAFLEKISMSPGMLTFIRAESLGADEATRDLVQQTYRSMASHHWDELKLMEGVGRPDPETRSELLAYAIVGVMENTSMRLSWDHDFSVEDYLWASLEVFLALRTLYVGPFDIGAEKKKYASLIHDLGENPDWKASRVSRDPA
jgi:AcrR family transcriptional regulator